MNFCSGAIDRARHDTASLKPIHTSRLHGLRIQLLTRNRHYADLVRQRVFCGETDFARCETCRVAVLSPEDSSLPPPPAWGEPIFHPRQFEKLLDDSPLRATYFHDRRVWQIYDHRAKVRPALVDRAAQLLRLGAGCSAAVFSPLVAIDFRTCDWLMRAALGKGGAGILLAGRGGSGKSGTVVGGIAHGLESVGDDYVLLDNAPDAVHAYPLFQTLKQDRSGITTTGIGNANLSKPARRIGKTSSSSPARRSAVKPWPPG